ncbi:hypothetical protein Q0P22_14875, partial [Staphylococcus aureus]|nr:hypothetical protein [Staphylococcus aureus]
MDATWLANFADELAGRAKKQSLVDVMADFMSLIHGCPESQKRLEMASTTSRGAIESVIAPGLAARPSPLACVA